MNKIKYKKDHGEFIFTIPNDEKQGIVNLYGKKIPWPNLIDKDYIRDEDERRANFIQGILCEYSVLRIFKYIGMPGIKNGFNDWFNNLKINTGQKGYDFRINNRQYECKSYKITTNGRFHCNSYMVNPAKHWNMFVMPCIHNLQDAILHNGKLRDNDLQVSIKCRISIQEYLKDMEFYYINNSCKQKADLNKQIDFNRLYGNIDPSRMQHYTNEMNTIFEVDYGLE
jgi:hypothetical protein